VSGAGATGVIDNDQTRCDAYTRLERRMGLQATYSRHQLQARPHGSLGVVLMGLGIPK
jgi:hypothetical protein